VADWPLSSYEHRIGDAVLLVIGHVSAGFMKSPLLALVAVDAQPDDVAVLLGELGHRLLPRVRLETGSWG